MLWRSCVVPHRAIARLKGIWERLQAGAVAGYIDKTLLVNRWGDAEGGTSVNDTPKTTAYMKACPVER
jgi:hypothetical protein